MSMNNFNEAGEREEYSSLKGGNEKEEYDMAKLFKEEVEEILMGHIARNANDELEIFYDPLTNFTNGAYEGSVRTRLFGVSGKLRRYIQVSNVRQAEKKVRAAFADMGRKIHMHTRPDTVNYLITNFWLRPALMIFTFEEKVPVVRIYTARGPFSFIARRFFLKKLENMSDGALLREEKTGNEGGGAKKRREKKDEK